MEELTELITDLGLVEEYYIMTDKEENYFCEKSVQKENYTVLNGNENFRISKEENSIQPFTSGSTNYFRKRSRWSDKYEDITLTHSIDYKIPLLPYEQAALNETVKSTDDTYISDTDSVSTFDSHNRDLHNSSFYSHCTVTPPPPIKKKRLTWDGVMSKSIEKSVMQHTLQKLTISAPMYKDYQLLGDSQLLRFSQQILKEKLSDFRGTQPRGIGYCISGQTTKELLERLIAEESPLHRKVILMIGTNDFKKWTPIKSFFEQYDKILEHLTTRTDKIILLTVPPIARYDKSQYHITVVKQFNDHIKSKKNGKTIFCVDIAPAYISYDNKFINEYYEPIFGNNAKKVDLIHLNNEGFKILKLYLDLMFFDKI